MGCASQVSNASSQTPFEHGPSSSEQSRAVPVHMPLLHESPIVQKRPSSQPLPSLVACALQLAVPSLHRPTEQTPCCAEQPRGVGPTHVPPVHTSPTVQN